LYNLAREYLYSGHREKAAGIAERCLAQYPNTYHCHFARGAIHLEQKEFEQALQHIKRALDLRPDSGVAHNHLGLILENLGALEEARVSFRRASQLGFWAANNHLSRLDGSGSGPVPANMKAVVPPGTSAARQGE
jgi:Flp pilus assembly protein TadD